MDQNCFGSHLIVHWRTHTVNFCRKANPMSIQWLGQPNPNPILLHYRSIPCLNTMLVSVRYLVTLLKYSLFNIFLRYTQHFYKAELYPILTHFWGIAYPITSLSNSQFQYITELYPILTHCWGIAYLITLLSYSQIQYVTELYPILTHCWGISNINILLIYIYRILVHCRTMVDLKILVTVFAKV